ncbi:efflux RND transporter periplasmic adaptor subunit [Blastopirellula sp. JC732]|uniref:Efflux RND transporter periplasmic adaptor subunit n=1 Tax=Blastopirellula sediminis TaxID=2894196 RepID=A0A9X1MNR0_9BACT|nr:efflux RND transporter periplasmic adaptor subunit [Blastopirellula sediminis]MCC9608374.1 efflux RND transporter periplasmic adaptor subunit [Blastopirellula sediminis]MCC9628849.1 efflux RND transporter periplasmic adaptor subunit [Blastopirellula sediminis]
MNSSVDLRQLAIDRGATTIAPRRRLLTRYVIPGAIAAGFLALVAWSLRDFAFPPTAVTVSPVISVRSAQQRGGSPLFQAAGWIEPRPTPIRVAALAPGIVESLLVVDDQPIRKGEPIAKLVVEDAQLALERAEADVKLREAEMDEAKSNLVAANTRLEEPVHLEAILGDSEAMLAQLETLLKNLPFETTRAIARREYAQIDFESKERIRTSIAAREVDAAKSEFDAADALVRELQQRQSALESQQTALRQRRDAIKRQLELLTDEKKAVGESTARLKAAEARVAQAKVQMAEAQLRLDRMTISAPVTGRIYQLIGHPGAKVGGDLTRSVGYDGSTIVTMYQPDKLQVRVDVRFEDVPHVSLRQSVEINNPALSAPLTGQVLYISSEADIQKNTLQVKVALDNPPPFFKPEMLVDVTFLEPQHQVASTEPNQQRQLLIPATAIHTSGLGDFVWLADQSDRRAVRQAIKTGAKVDDLVEIADGLNVTSRVITSAVRPLAEGDRIVVQEDASPAANASPQRSQLSRLPSAGNS